MRVPEIEPQMLTCYCEGHCPDQAENGTCKVNVGGKCFSSVTEEWDQETLSYVQVYSFGCLSTDYAGGLLQVSREYSTC